MHFEVARTREEVAPALEIFLRLEASGWKAKRGTALMQDEGDAAFIRRAVLALAELSQCEVVTLHAGDAKVVKSPASIAAVGTKIRVFAGSDRMVVP